MLNRINECISTRQRYSLSIFHISPLICIVSASNLYKKRIRNRLPYLHFTPGVYVGKENSEYLIFAAE